MTERFPAILCSLRKERKLNQRAAAADLHISQALLSHYENGLREPGLGFVDAACRYYGVSADYLLGRSPLRAPLPGPALAESPGLAADAELLLEALSALLAALAAAPETAEAAAELINLTLYELLRCFDGASEYAIPQALCRPLCGAASQLLWARLLDRSGGEATPQATVPARLRQTVENELSVLRDDWR